MTVDAVVDGEHIPNLIVTNGAVSFPEQGGKDILVGLAYTAKLTTMNLEFYGAKRQLFRQFKRSHELTVKYLNSLGGKAGIAGQKLEALIFRQGNDRMDEIPQLFTGQKKISVSSTADYETQAVLVQDQPLPLTLLALFAEVN